ncbi:MAG: hypothetical protein CISAcid_07940 [uncultured Acidilobus sp. CIS]|nr:MAG: hypothetical protein CISAcid_07940 [uncultured Acidilobus sp. CIS]
MSRPARSLSVVVLPAPLGPRRAYLPPSGTSKERPLRAGVEP